MKAYRGSGCLAPFILNPALEGGEWSASPSSRFIPENSGTNSVGNWVSLRSGLDVLDKETILCP